jgi:hypothetical protein
MGHTPGPWTFEAIEWDERFGHVGSVVAVTKSGNIGQGKGEFRIGRRLDDQCSWDHVANARLIAAAPTLLAACKLLISHEGEAAPDKGICYCGCGAIGRDDCMPDCPVKAAREAVARATED